MPGCTITLVNDNLFLWNIVLEGPAGTPYEGGRFTLKAEVRRAPTAAAAELAR